ncbi:MAG: type II toxin-antitoxin system VapC family toxin [Asticcacaulis sp.]
MVLADTSVWVDYLRRPNDRLLQAMQDRQILSHPFVIGELALGGHRVSMSLLLRKVTPATRASDEEVLALIHNRGLVGRGIGYVDAHLLASALLTPDAGLWTLDGKLHKVAFEAGVAA